MDDKRLLEAAARAAGLAVDRWYVDGGCAVWGGKPNESDWRPLWNPLTDDGDALRLAVKLDIVPRCINGVAFAWRDGVCDMQEPVGDDPLAATRRAITRAAAELGKQNGLA